MANLNLTPLSEAEELATALVAAVSLLRKNSFRIERQKDQVVVGVQAPDSEEWRFLRPTEVVMLADKVAGR